MATKAVKEETMEDEFNLDKKVTVKSLASWGTGFRRLDGVGDVSIAPNGSTRLTRNEIMAQINNNNRLFVGVDGAGSHATLFIDDKATRAEVGFDTKEHEQSVFSDSMVQELFKNKSEVAFEKEFKEKIVTRAEKSAVMQAIKRLNINDYSKIKFAENYTGFKL